MQPTNKPKTQRSRCTFCGSTDRGKGCRFGPHGVHFHPDDTTKCAYCGSSDYGKGCRINPTSNLHIHGSVYNNMYKETVQSFLDNNILLKELKKNYKEFQCYALGIIDENGNKIKNPVTESEQLSYTPFTKTVLKLKKYLGSKIELMEASECLDTAINLNENIEHYKKVLMYQDKVESIVNELYKTLDEAQQDGLPLEDIKKLVKA
jgi:hypothetical protein